MESGNPTQERRKICPLCEREIPRHLESRHHLVPKLKGGKHGPIEILHRACHSKIHAVFTETELAREFNTIGRLVAHPEIAKFVRWINKRPISFHAGTRSKRRERRR